MSKTGHPGKIV